MTRRKVELTWITNQSARRASLRKRRVGLLKKVQELTTLCGIKSCLFMYNPGDMLDDFNVHELDQLICFGETSRKTIMKRVEFYKQVPYSLVGPS
ncbi:hypothetical protein GQ457_11G031700 [Hibiscus cannabinus]